MKNRKKRVSRPRDNECHSATIPIQMGVKNITIEASPWDRHSVVLTLPPECLGTVHLPRDFFADRIVRNIAPKWST